MDEREIIILTKSNMKSYSEKSYCIAGIDAKSGEWVRLVREDGQPVKKDDISYHNDNEVEVLDVVKIDLKCKKPFYANDGHNSYIYQPENYVMGGKPLKIRESNISEVLNLHPIENKNPIFYNHNKKVSPYEIKSIPEEDKYSLTLIKVKNVKIYKKKYDYDDGSSKEKIRCNFEYNNMNFVEYPVTDIEIIDKIYKNSSTIELDEAIFIMSLGENYYGFHYKIIAQIF